MNCKETALNQRCRDEFRLSLGQVAALVVLLTGYRIHERPMAREAIESVMKNTYGTNLGHGLLVLEKMGYAARSWRYGPAFHRSTWVPTPLALKRFPEPEPEVMPGLAKVRVGRKAQQERRAG